MFISVPNFRLKPTIAGSRILKQVVTIRQKQRENEHIHVSSQTPFPAFATIQFKIPYLGNGVTHSRQVSNLITIIKVIGHRRVYRSAWSVQSFTETFFSEDSALC